jgi:hypothetical protein
MSIPAHLERKPKRVILRLRVGDFDDGASHFDEVYEAIKTYLVYAGHSPNEAESKQHFVHMEPLQSLDVPQTSFHVFLDMEKDLKDTPGLDALPHEIYRVKRDEARNL